MSKCMSMRVSMHTSVCMSIRVSMHMSVCMSIRVPMHMSMCMLMRVSMHVYTHANMHDYTHVHAHVACGRWSKMPRRRCIVTWLRKLALTNPTRSRRAWTAPSMTRRESDILFSAHCSLARVLAACRRAT